MITLFEQKTKVQSKPDLILKDFFKQKEHFVDLINATLFHGNAQFREDECVLYDANETTHFVFDDVVMGINRQRDILMKVSIQDIPMFIGLENQAIIDYTMPFRVLVYDTIAYYRQYQSVKESQRKSLRPVGVLTLVLYTGDKHWRQPYSLLERIQVPPVLQEVLNDWRGNIYDIKEINPEWLRNSHVKAVVKAVQQIYAWDKNIESFKELVLSKELALVVAVMTNSDGLRFRIEKEEKEEINMCSVIDECLQEREMMGIKQGLKQGMIQTIIKLIKAKFGNVSEELVMKIEMSSEEKIDELTIKIIDVKNEEEIMEILS